MALVKYERGGKYAVFRSDQPFEYVDSEGIRAYFQAGMAATRLKSKEELNPKNPDTIHSFFWVDNFVDVGFANTPFFFKPSNSVLQFVDNGFFKIYKMAIGGWDCDTVASIAITMPGSITDDKVEWARATIIRDDGRERWMLNADNIGQIHLLTVTPTLIYLNRITGGVLDNVNYNDPLVNRGYVYIAAGV